jgi:myo-inositol-1(or 4)-monophosphatase
MVQEAGGLIGDLRGDPGFLESGRVVCGNPKIFAQLVQIVGPLASR